MQTLLTTPHLTIYLHKGDPGSVVELSWLSYATSQQFREALLQALDLFAQHRGQGWISDDRYLGAVRPRDLEWAFLTAPPRLTELGLRRMALLESQDVLNRRTIDAAYQQNEPTFGFELRRFTDLTEARTWALGLDSLA